MSNSHAIILAGGSGSRLWPLSRTLHSKQLLPLDGTMLKILDISKIQKLRWQTDISLVEGVKLTYGGFIARCSQSGDFQE